MQSDPEVIPDVELVRAQAYALLATLLARPPSGDLLRRLQSAEGDRSRWGMAVGAIAAAARRTDPKAVEREFNRLFIGLQRGELVPYASYYLTGFLHDRPLVELRGEMARLGLALEADVAEPEDHIAAMLEIMAGLIDGRFGCRAPRRDQQDFYDRHLARWAPRFFRDLEQAKEAHFYRTVGAAGSVLFEIEEGAAVLAE